MALTLEAQNPDCSSLRDEAETLRQELALLVKEVREYALSLENCDDPTLDNVADTLLNILAGEPR